MPLAQQILDAAPDATVVAQNTDFPGTEFLGAWVASNSAVEEKPEELTRFLMAYADGQLHPSEIRAVRSVAAGLQVDAGTFEAALVMVLQAVD